MIRYLFALVATASMCTPFMAYADDPIPVIFDTDIGTDIDDMWALIMLLNSPELDVKLIVSDTGDTTYRAKLIAKTLEVAGRTDIPVGIGKTFEHHGPYRQGPWVEDYDLADYPGIVFEDGVRAIIETIMSSDETTTLICVGPVPNIGEALKREPRIADKARFVGMHGSVYKGYGMSDTPHTEYNVRSDVPACQAAFTASWDITITPLDTCGNVVLDGDRYQTVRNSESPLVRALMENYRDWLTIGKQPVTLADEKSSTLFDTVAIYLAFSTDLAAMSDLPIRVTDEGYTVVHETAKTLHVATDWKDFDAFKDLLVERLIAR